MRTSPILTILAGMGLAWALAAPAAVSADSVHGPLQTVDGYVIQLSAPEAARVPGSNDVVVSIRDAAGAPVTRASVVAAITLTAAAHRETAGGGHAQQAADEHGTADPHGTAEVADSHRTAATADPHGTAGATGHSDGPAGQTVNLIETSVPGVYQGRVDVAAPGAWTVTVTVTTARARSAAFPLEITSARPAGLVLGGFAAINGGVVLAAALVRRRRARLAPARLVSPSAA